MYVYTKKNKAYNDFSTNTYSTQFVNEKDENVLAVLF